MDGKIKEQSIEEILETMTEEQAKFVIHASVVANHLPRYWFEEAVKLSRSVKHD